MNNGVCGVLCLALVSTTLLAQSGPVLLSATIPAYPPLARQARIEGIVKLIFTLGLNAEPADVQVVSGHPALKSAAIGNVQTWRFQSPHPEGKYETEFDYRLRCSGPERVSFESFRRVEVISCAPMHSD